MKRLLLPFLIIILLLCSSSPVIAAQDIEQKINKLERKVAKKCSNTFCNSTGFGISNEGALNFSLGETKSEFSNNSLIDKVDLKAVKEKILVDIGDTCYFFELNTSDLDDLTLEYKKK